MTSDAEGAPPNVASLDGRITGLANERQTTALRLASAVASTVIGQMLPPGVVKGGTAMKVRVGEAGSRFTTDIDASRSASLPLDDYLEQLAELLSTGWSGFTGRAAKRQPADPPDVPTDYLMQPFDIALSYRSRTWETVRLELGRDEVGSTSNSKSTISSDLVELFERLGLDQPGPIPVMAAEHQIAQKLHACTSVGRKSGTNDRAHDLVDLQILVREEAFELRDVREVAHRLFAARRLHVWPPTVVSHPRWDSLYAEAADGLAVLPDVTKAVAWANRLIADIESAV